MFHGTHSGQLRGRNLTARFLSLALLLAMLVQCMPAAWAAPVKKTIPAIKQTRPAVSALGAMSVEAKLKLTPVQISQRLPMLSLPSSTKLVLRRDSGTEFHSEFTEWTVHWRDKSAMNLKFGWTTKQKNAVSAVWQVSEMRFSQDAKYWKTPPGLAASGTAPMQTGPNQAVFYIDFAKFAPQPPSQKFVAISAMPAASRDAIKQTVALSKPGPKRLIAKVKKPSALSAAAQLKLKAEPLALPARTYYVRVVTLDSKGKCVGAPSNAVEITYGEYPQDPVTWFGVDPNNPDKSSWPKVAHPKVRILKYAPIQEQVWNATYRFEVIRDWPPGMASWKAGQKLDFTPHAEDKSWWEEVGDFISDVVGFVGDAVNWVANAYESIKEFAVNLVCEALGDWAKGPLMMGLNIGLTALGIPPTLPDWSELTSMGKDYLIQAAADYAGLPAEETTKVVNAVIDKAREQENGGGNPAIWLKPDPEAYYRPAYLLLEVTNPSQQVTDRVGLRVHVDPVGDPEFEKYDEPTFRAGMACIPHMNPGDKFVIPVYLTEYTQLRQLDTNPHLGTQRFWRRYHMMPGRVYVDTWFPDNHTQNPYVTHQTLILQKCYQSYKAPGVN